MDPLAHTLAGAAAAEALPARWRGRGTTIAFAAASNLPDLDVLSRLLWGKWSFLYRRSFTHSLPMVPLWAAVFAFLWGRFDARLSFRTRWGLSCAALSLHTLLDLVNSYGVVLWFPFSWARWELAWLFIVDLAVWGILLAPILVRELLPATRAGPFRVALAALALYLAFAAAGRARAEAHLAPRAAGADFAYVFPEPLGPHRFRGVVRRGTTYEVYLVRPWAGGPEAVSLAFREATDLDAPSVRRARARPEARDFEWFAKAPVWKATASGAQVYDLRFRSVVIPRERVPFVFEFFAASSR